MIVTKIRRRNKKKQEKANNSPSYRCAAIKQEKQILNKNKTFQNATTTKNTFGPVIS